MKNRRQPGHPKSIAWDRPDFESLKDREPIPGPVQGIWLSCQERDRIVQYVANLEGIIGRQGRTPLTREQIIALDAELFVFNETPDAEQQAYADGERNKGHEPFFAGSAGTIAAQVNKKTGLIMEAQKINRWRKLDLYRAAYAARIVSQHMG